MCNFQKNRSISSYLIRDTTVCLDEFSEISEHTRFRVKSWSIGFQDVTNIGEDDSNLGFLSKDVEDML